MLPPCSCNNCPICFERKRREVELDGQASLLVHHCTCKVNPGDDPTCDVHSVAEAWFAWAVEIVDELGLSAGPRANPIDVEGWTIAELRDRIRDLAMTCQETRQELRALYEAGAVKREPFPP
jgi:hypothetical protein